MYSEPTRQCFLANHPRNQPSLYKSLALLFILFPISVLSSSHHTLSVSQTCKNAHDPLSCHAMVSEAISSHNGRLFQTNDILKAFLAKSKRHIQDALTLTRDLIIRHHIQDAGDQATVNVNVGSCVELMELSMGRVVDSVDALTMGSYDDAHSWLSAVLTNYFTCLDELSGPARALLEPRLDELIARSRASLAMLVAMQPSRERHLLESATHGFPYWMSNRDRKLLEAATPGNYIKPNVVVAQDGSGNYTTVTKAVASAPNNAKTKHVIYVKKGTYKENVVIAKTKKNVVLVGEGMNHTIITGSLNMVDGTSTLNTSTVVAFGDGFMAQDIWFQNTAGPQKGQAVALLVAGDRSIIYRCRIDAYQDTLCPFTNRQFYRDSIVTGTVDFIFGNAAVIFQNCQLVARKPLAGQANVVTAQGRVDPNQNTGTSMQGCQITASSDLEPFKRSVKSYLGRPWKEYSRTVVMESDIGDLIDPSGWLPMNGAFALKTLYYGEYANRGPGSGTSKRVTWPGYHVITSPAVASNFTVARLIQGSSWIKPTGVPYRDGL